MPIGHPRSAHSGAPFGAGASRSPRGTPVISPTARPRRCTTSSSGSSGWPSASPTSATTGCGLCSTRASPTGRCCRASALPERGLRRPPPGPDPLDECLDTFVVLTEHLLGAIGIHAPPLTPLPPDQHVGRTGGGGWEI